MSLLHSSIGNIHRLHAALRGRGTMKSLSLSIFPEEYQSMYIQIVWQCDQRIETCIDWNRDSFPTRQASTSPVVAWYDHHDCVGSWCVVSRLSLLYIHEIQLLQSICFVYCICTSFPLHSAWLFWLATYRKGQARYCHSLCTGQRWQWSGISPTTISGTIRYTLIVHNPDKLVLHYDWFLRSTLVDWPSEYRPLKPLLPLWSLEGGVQATFTNTARCSVHPRRTNCQCIGVSLRWTYLWSISRSS